MTESRPPAATPEPSPPTPTQMRQAMSNFASGVTIVTGSANDTPVGFACQSFASVSLSPPLVLFCADHRGRTWPRIRESGRFTVNVLADDQADLCDRFGTRNGLKYDGLEWHTTKWGTPALPGVLMLVHCEVHDVHVAGDHDVVIGRVLEVEHGQQGHPMIFFRGAFGVDEQVPVTVPDLWGWGWGDHWG